MFKISIPSGAIKSFFFMVGTSEIEPFQFLLVRLKEKHIETSRGV